MLIICRRLHVNYIYQLKHLLRCYQGAVWLGQAATEALLQALHTLLSLSFSECPLDCQRSCAYHMHWALWSLLV